MKVFNFEDARHLTNFGTFRGRRVLHLPKKPEGNQYPEVLRILVPPEILVALHNLTSTPYVQLKIFPVPIYKVGLSIYDPVTICNFLKKLVQNKYIRVRS